MEHQANVTLTALNAKILPSKRVLNFHPHRRVIQIGRASKSISKGLLGAEDNAWFDSPVMSRDHAEISLNPDNHTITIQDIGSMHGTYLNNIELQRKDPRILNDGDIVVFGAEVRRGVESFPACAFRINYEFLPWKPGQANTFKFPESSDVEDEHSEEDVYGMEGQGEPYSDDDSSIESRPAKLSTSICSIDLTRDESEVAEVFEVPQGGGSIVDGQASADRRLMDTVVTEVAEHAPSTGEYAENPLILTDSDAEDEDSASDSENLSDEIESEAPDSICYGSEADSDSGDCDQEHTVEASEVAVPDSQGHETSQEVVFDTISPHAEASINTPLSNLRTRIETSEEIMSDDDNQSDLGLSDAGANGIRALFEDETFENDCQNQEHQAESDRLRGNSNLEDDGGIDLDSVDIHEVPFAAPISTKKVETSKRVTFASLPSDSDTGSIFATSIAPQSSFPSGSYASFGIPGAASTFSAHSKSDVALGGHTTDHANQPRSDFARGFSFDRQPSPSDAAMVKNAAHLSRMRDQIANPVTVYHLPSQDWRQLTAQSLGDKTGKHAFFLARESNRTKMNAGDSGAQQPPQPVQATRVAASTRTANNTFGVSDSSRNENINIPSALPSMSQRQSVPFLDDHSHAPSINRAVSPEPDMTSAVRYNDSKASMAMSGSNQSTSVKQTRSTLSTPENAEHLSKDQATKTLKRKADNISEATEEEVRIWASSPGSDAAKRPVKDLEYASNMSILPSQTQTPKSSSHVSLATVASLPEHQPTKRLKRFAEAAGYAALGGAAVGACLFSVLVTTAPDFL
jgi:hypothetical protein